LNTALAQTTAPDNYSCGDSQNNHCYAFYQWYGSINGGKTDITVPFLGGRPGTDGFMNWETWILQNYNSGCGNINYACWVEAGISDACCTLGEYFWADERPGGGYHNHYTYQVGPDDYIERFQIYRQDSTDWYVSGSVVSCGYPYTCSHSWSGLSTSNTYSPDEIQIGIELAGTYGQPGYGADWTNNYWRCGGNWCPQNSLGNPGSGPSWIFGIKQGPLTGDWITEPSKTSTGDWNAYCASC